MGFFSWLDCKTGEAVKIGDEAFLLVPKKYTGVLGERIRTTSYNGYGDFDGFDVFALVAGFNSGVLPSKLIDEMFLQGDDLRNIGIEFACEDDDNRRLKYPIKITKDVSAIYEDCKPSNSDPLQGCE